MDVIKDMQDMVIEEFKKFLDYSEIGKEYNYSGILNKISFINTLEELDRPFFIYEYFKSNQ